MKILLEKEEVQSSKFECPKAVVFKLWVATHCWNFVSAGVNVSELAQTAPGPCAICRDKGNLKGSPFFARASLWVGRAAREKFLAGELKAYADEKDWLQNLH
ncbi:hypothetical protein T4D_14188 [Trichinella pseudospiralis]|uniref:Uncharacterized protein n=1 Tax=Trichinella pseudospiralis TaxID=6337 RepID=A0A0V1FSM7_TRIPS|nr:hypothetical protein T4D_14188 [Trichinella pseudospiralis]